MCRFNGLLRMRGVTLTYEHIFSLCVTTVGKIALQVYFICASS